MSNGNEKFEGVERKDGASQPNRSIKGYRVVVAILIVILVAISGLYFNIHRNQQADYELLSQDREGLKKEISAMIVEYDELESDNASLNASMKADRERADSVISKLTKERDWNYSKLKQYEKEVGTLRNLMRGYLHQIDSLNSLNQKLIDENVGYRKEISSQQLRASLAEERAEELNNKVRQGALLSVRDINIVPLNTRDREVSRIRSASRLRVDFALSANSLNKPGERTVYLRIISPDGYVLTSSDIPTFEYEGKKLTYSDSRAVDYQNEDIDVSIFFDGAGFESGIYSVELFCDGHMLGERKIEMK